MQMCRHLSHLHSDSSCISCSVLARAFSCCHVHVVRSSPQQSVAMARKKELPVLEVHMKELERHPWFHGYRLKDRLARLFKDPGDWLVRVSNRESVLHRLILVIKKDNGSLKMLRIARNRANKQYYLIAFEQKGITVTFFDTPTQLIEFYRENRISRHTMLGNAIARPNYYITAIDITLGEEIGRGEFGTVHVGSLNREGVLVTAAIKLIKDFGTPDNWRQMQVERDAILKEAESMSLLSDHHIVEFFGVVTTPPNVMLVLAFCAGGALNKHLLVQKDEISLGERLIYMVEAARGVAYLHARQVVHRDLAARNCLISETGRIKIADFGLSRLLDNDLDEVQIDQGSRLPIRTMAPECIAPLLKDRIYSKASDVWAFGCMMVEILRNGIGTFLPKEIYKLPQIKESIRRGVVLPVLDRRTIPKDLYLTVQWCHRKEAKDRWTMRDVRSVLETLVFEHPPPPCKDFTLGKLPGVVRTEHDKSGKKDEDENSSTQTMSKSSGKGRTRNQSVSTTPKSSMALPDTSAHE